MSRLFEIIGLEQVTRLDGPSLPLTIGNGEADHVRLPGDGGALAWVGESRGHLFLQPAEGLPSGVLCHNDQFVTGSTWIKSGDTTRIGDFLIHWQLSGQRVEIRVSQNQAWRLTPPAEPPLPPVRAAAPGDAAPAPVPAPLEPPSRAGKRKVLVLGLFVLLLAGAAFVLLANPLAVTITPDPDHLSISGFPPVVPFGDRYLGLAGSYVVHARKRGYLPLAEPVEISASGSHYRFNLEKLPGLLDVTTDPPGVTVLVDGAVVGITPLTELAMPAGSHRLRFEHDRYFDREQQIEIRGLGEKQSLQATLEPAWAKVSLQTAPPGALLAVDGERQGVTPLELELIDGERRLVFSKDEFLPLAVDLTVTAGQNISPPAYQLQPAPGSLKIDSTPRGATLSLDGVFKGVSPLTISLPGGEEHLLQATAAGFLPASRKVELAPGEERQIKIELAPEYGTVFVAATPPHATLYIDGEQQARSNGRFKLTTRQHTLELRAEGYPSVTRQVTPRAGYSQRIEINLPRGQVTAQNGQTSLAAAARTALGQKLVLIKPGPFQMGASRQEAGRRANEGERQVALQRSFYLAEREVTNREFLQFQPGHSSGVAGRQSLELDSRPVVNVSWNDAARFMNWLSEQDGLPPFYREELGGMVTIDPRGIGYRLPTEAEWAFAARMAGQNERVRYPWDGSFPPQAVVGNFADESARHLLPVIISGYTDGFAATSPTGSFAANPAGLYDLGGNAAEWCHDYYSVQTFSGGSEVDPMGPPMGTHRVVRGSSWRDASITELRFSYRRYSREAADDIGFRVARYAE